MYGTVIWQPHLNKIGGVERYICELVKKYKKYDVTVMYECGDWPMISKIQEHAPCIKWDGKPFECEVLIVGAAVNFCDFVTAKKYISVVHTDWSAYNPPIQPPTHPKITKYLGCSANSAKTFTEATGIECEVCFNPMVLEEPKRVLRLISATRLTAEKGRDRMEKLCEALDRAGVNYIWTVFTDDTTPFSSPNVFFHKCVDNVRDYIACSDYLVQLSSTEGYCYAVREALAMSVPCIVSEHPSFLECGVEHGKTGFILPFDMKNIPIKEIEETVLKFEPIEVNDGYGKILSKKKSTYEYDNSTVRVRATPSWGGLIDSQTGYVRECGEEWEVSRQRLNVLLQFEPKIVEVLG